MPWSATIFAISSHSRADLVLSIEGIPHVAAINYLPASTS